MKNSTTAFRVIAAEFNAARSTFEQSTDDQVRASAASDASSAAEQLAHILPSEGRTAFAHRDWIRLSEEWATKAANLRTIIRMGI